MKSVRFQILMATLVALVTTKLASSQLKERMPKEVINAYKAMNAPVCTHEVQGQTAKLLNGTGAYIAANIGKGSANTELITSDLKSKLGVSTFGYTLKAGELLVFDRLVIEHATAASGTAVEDITSWSKSLPAEWKNASIEIYTNGRGKKVFEGQLNVIADHQNNSSKPFYQLFDPAFLLDDQSWQIVIKQPTQFSGADDHYIRVNMDGAKTYIG